MKTIISLCDYTGNMVKPWIENGYQAFLVDPQHGTTRTEGGITKFAGTIEDAMPAVSELIRSGKVAAVFGFPPCTNLAVSGARHFDRKMTDKAWKHYQGPNMFSDAARIAWQCEMVGQLAGVVDDRIDRRVKTGAKDRGDIGGVRVHGQKLVLECKNTSRTNLGTWISEAHVEAGNDDALAGVIVHKRHGVGDPGRQWVTMTVDDLIALMTGEPQPGRYE